MRTFSIILIIFIRILSGESTLAQGTGYFTIKGKQFYDPQGRAFYPLIINYSCDVTYDHSNANPTANDLFISPLWGYGINKDGYDCNDLQSCVHTQIHNDFIKIKSMGFNTIRLNGVGFCKNIDAIGGVINPVNSYDNLFTFPQFRIMPPYNTGNAQIVFDLLSEVLQEAEACSLAVLLNENYQGYIILPTPNWQANVDDYAEYLKEKAKYFKNFHNLLAYEILHEPNFYVSPIRTPSKFEVCNHFAKWYDSVKDNDPNHLITYGGLIGDVFAWDPAVSKADFYAPHLYSTWGEGEVPATGTYDLTITQNRLQGYLYYLNKTATKPWVIGETGFSAIDDDAGYTATGQDVPPFVDGTVAEQGAYAENSLNWFRDCDASGYGWWNFQENNWYSSYQDGFGLLRHGDISQVGNSKDVSTKFATYLTNNQAPAPVLSSCVKPANYYDPYNIEANHPSFPNTITGYVRNIQSNEFIPNAFILGGASYNYPDPLILGFKLIGFSQQNTYSSDEVNSVGWFSVNPFHVSIDAPIIYKLLISCIGGDVLGEGSEYGQTPYPYVQSGIDHLIAVNTMHYDETIKQLSIPLGSSGIFKGWNSLTIESHPTDIIVEGTADFTARTEVNIRSEFTASLNSEVHIFTSEVFNDCQEYTNYHTPRIKRNYVNVPQKNNLIELNFKIASNLIVAVFPNPSEHKITIRVNAGYHSPVNYSYLISDLSGKIIIQKTSDNVESCIDVSSFSKGIYLLTVQCNSFFTKNKIVVQ